MGESSSTRVEFHLGNVCKVLVDPVDRFDSFVISNVDHQREVYSREKSGDYPMHPIRLLLINPIGCPNALFN